MKPKSVMILGERVKVTYLKDDPAKSYHAIFYPDNLKIEVYDTIFWDRSLMHELIHAAFHVSGINNLLDEQVEEAICACLENALFGVYKLK